MSSVYSLLKSGKVSGLPAALGVSSRVDELLAIATRHSEYCILANIQGCIDEVRRHPDAVELAALPRLTPPHAHMWMEGLFPGPKSAVQIVRRPVPTLGGRPPGGDGWLVGFYPWFEINGSAFLGPFSTTLILGADGSFGSFVHGQMYTADFGELASSNRHAEWLFAVCCYALAKLNCSNIALDPPPFQADGAGRSLPRLKPKAALASVWRTLVIKDVPGVTPEARADADTRPREDGRLRWIRGHFADYSKGRGLFGNAKLRKCFWIPEHQVGNPDLGEEIDDYEL